MNDKCKKDLGTVFTPPITARYIISRLGEISKKARILDPCVGNGVFVRELLRKGISPKQIYAFDINPIYRNNILKLGVSFESMDTLLSFSKKEVEKYDIIVGNPPYLNKSSNYVKTNRKQLKKIYGKINSHETYSMFIVNGIWRLKEGGRLGFITSDSFLSLRTHEKLRNFILSTCIINEILLSPKDLFLKQKVKISPAIIILTKCSGEINKQKREENIIRVIPRLKTEKQYWNPPKIIHVKQKNYHSLPFSIFFIDVEKEIIELFKKAPKLEKYLKGYIGMHTHDNRRFIAAIEGTNLAKNFIKKNLKIKNKDEKFIIIPRKELESSYWKPYLKRGGKDQYYRPIMEAIKWDEESKKNYDIPKNVPFEREGIIVSGISSRLAARYMPKGCYWDSNKAMGFILNNKNLSIEYMLGLLNSSLYNYLAKGIINNTSSIQLTGIHALPFIVPDKLTKEKVEFQVRKIIKKKKEDPNYDFCQEQKYIDNLIFELYSKEFDLPKELKIKLDTQFSIYK